MAHSLLWFWLRYRKTHNTPLTCAVSSNNLLSALLPSDFLPIFSLTEPQRQETLAPYSRWLVRARDRSWELMCRQSPAPHPRAPWLCRGVTHMVRESQLPQRVELLGMLIGKKSTYMTWRRLRTVCEVVGTIQTNIL